MSKKQKAINAELTNLESEKQDDITQGVVTEDKKAKKPKDEKVKGKNKKKEKKNKENKGGVVKKTKETFSELKKVTWPTFGEVVKNTGIVIAFVLIFGLFLFGVNTLLGWLIGLLV